MNKTIVGRDVLSMGMVLLVLCAIGSPKLMTVLPALIHDADHSNASSLLTPTTLAGLRLPFIDNQGQMDPRVAYYASTFAGNVFVTRDGKLVYGFQSRPESFSPVSDNQVSPAAHGNRYSITESFVGGHPHPATGENAVAHASYFIGNDAKMWRTRVPTYTQVLFGDVWPGIAVHVQAHGNNVEKIFTVQSGADVASIRMHVAGAHAIHVQKNGALVLDTALGAVTFSAPVAYQEILGAQQPVTVAYALHDQEYGFTLGTYDPALPVVIDPILQSTYLGGTGNDIPYLLTIHPTTSQIYVAGSTTSVNFPGTTGGAQPALAGVNDAFIAILSADLTNLLQATYLGGTNQGETIQSLLIHPGTGDVFVTGGTVSNDFPATAGAAYPTYAGGLSDAFVARLSGDLTTLRQSTYLGGTGLDLGVSIAFDAGRNEIYVAGTTDSVNFPDTAGAAQQANGQNIGGFGSRDGFIARLNPALTVVNQATYYGGTGSEWLSNSLAIHTNGDIYIAGSTDSSTVSGSLPGVAGGAQTTLSGGTDFFVARFSPTLTAITQATYLGGTGLESSGLYTAGDGAGRNLIIHPGTGDIYVAGSTSSTDFPFTSGGALSTNTGNAGFITRLDASLTATPAPQSTYILGTSIGSIAYSLFNSEIYVAGATALSGILPWTTGGAQPTSGGGTYDASIFRVNSALTTINQATFLGGSGNEFGGAGLAIHPVSGDVFVTTRTSSANFPFVTGGAQGTLGGGTDTTVSRITADLQAVSTNADVALAITDLPDPGNVNANLIYTITVTNNGPAAATGVSVSDTLPASLSFVSSTPSQGSCSGTGTVSCSLGGLANSASATITIVGTPTATGTLSNTATVTSTSTDTNSGNDSATSSTTVNAASADVRLSGSAPGSVGINNTATYALTVTNNGPSSATGATLTSSLTGGSFTFGSISPSQGSCTGTTTSTCTLGGLANGASATVTIAVTPTAVGSVTLTANVSATEPDSNAGNNSSVLTVSAVNTVCSNSLQRLAANTFGARLAGCSVTIGGASSVGGGGSIGLGTLVALMLLAFGRRRAR